MTCILYLSKKPRKQGEVPLPILSPIPMPKFSILLLGWDWDYVVAVLLVSELFWEVEHDRPSTILIFQIKTVVIKCNMSFYFLEKIVVLSCVITVICFCWISLQIFAYDCCCTVQIDRYAMFAHAHASRSHPSPPPPPPPQSYKLVYALVEPGQEKQGMSAVVVFIVQHRSLHNIIIRRVGQPISLPLFAEMPIWGPTWLPIGEH